MERYVLTGAPGAGKTALLRWLEVRGLVVVEEAATDVIALQQAQGKPEPHTDPAFIDAIVTLQRQRQERATGALQLFDRSPICTAALAEFLGYPASPLLRAELARIERERIYQRRVVFLENQGFVTLTAARRISYEASLAFGAVHRATYSRLGYDCIALAPADLATRGERLLDLLGITSPGP